MFCTCFKPREKKGSIEYLEVSQILLDPVVSSLHDVLMYCLARAITT